MSYPPIYVINLKRVPERKIHMQRQLDALNLNYQFIEAVDKHDLVFKKERAAIAQQLDIDESQMEALYRAHIAHIVPTSTSLGTMACMLSHLKVCNLMIKHNIPKACVLEDDAHLLPVFPKILVAAQKVPWDVLMLFHYSLFTINIVSHIRNKSDAKFRYFYRLVYYKKYYPHLNLHTVRWIISKTVKYLVLKELTKLFNIKITEYASNLSFAIGALSVPDRSTWYRSIPNYYIARTYRDSNKNCYVKSATAYMLTKSAAIKLRNEAILPREPLSIDSIISRTSSDLCLSIPPCIKMANIGRFGTR